MSLVITKKIIEDKILNHYGEYQKIFTEFQTTFLSDLYQRYQSLDNGNLALHFARQTHHSILRKKDYDLDFNLSFESFWENHKNAETNSSSIIAIAEESGLPKETARRKISSLIKQKILEKNYKKIFWSPNETYRKSYNQFINEEIKQISKLTKFITDKLKLNFSIDDIEYEYKKNFSFYWFHYLGVQLEYMKIWKNQLKDLELVLIALQLSNMIITKLKEAKLSHKSFFANPNLIKDYQGISVSATSISDVTGIPRATCIRKLNEMNNLKVIKQDKISKRYYIIPGVVTKNFISQETTESVVKIFSEYFFICIKALSAKTLN
jgi:hypothetical protein